MITRFVATTYTSYEDLMKAKPHFSPSSQWWDWFTVALGVVLFAIGMWSVGKRMSDKEKRVDDSFLPALLIIGLMFGIAGGYGAASATVGVIGGLKQYIPAKVQWNEDVDAFLDALPKEKVRVLDTIRSDMGSFKAVLDTERGMNTVGVKDQNIKSDKNSVYNYVMASWVDYEGVHKGWRNVVFYYGTKEGK